MMRRLPRIRFRAKPHCPIAQQNRRLRAKPRHRSQTRMTSRSLARISPLLFAKGQPDRPRPLSGALSRQDRGRLLAELRKHRQRWLNLYPHLNLRRNPCEAMGMDDWKKVNRTLPAPPARSSPAHPCGEKPSILASVPETDPRRIRLPLRFQRARTMRQHLKPGWNSSGSIVGPAEMPRPRKAWPGFACVTPTMRCRLT